MAKYLIATDGGARGNGDGTGASAWAFVVYDEGQFRKGSRSEGYPKHHRLTNNAMEGTAILEALKWLARRPNGTEAYIMSDSSYMVQCVNQWMDGWAANGWTKKSKGEIQNLQIMKDIYSIKQGLNFRLVHVKGHQTGNSFEATSNREADALCNVKMDEVEFETEVLK
tara:strand:- start:940 stop:1443 length:504 start_codon:yes stop_codon:yes gene_type:complete